MSEVFALPSVAAGGQRKRKRDEEEGEDATGTEIDGHGRTTIPPLLELLGDALATALSFLDAPSLVRVEGVSKSLKAVAEKAWTTIDYCLDGGTKADGVTARARVIGSCALYRRHALARYAERIERMDPNHADIIKFPSRQLATENYDFFVRFSPVRIQDEKSATKSLAEGVVIPDEEFSPGDEQDAMINFNLDTFDLYHWSAMQDFKEWILERIRSSVVSSTDEMFEISLEMFGKLHVTLVAINKKTLETCLVFMTDDDFDWDYYYGEEEQKYIVTNGYMVVDPGDDEEEDEEEEHDLLYRCLEMTYTDNSWVINLRNTWL